VSAKRILITGGCGFVGSNLAVALAADGHSVVCFDNLSRRGSELLLRRILDSGCHFVHGDIRSSEDFVKLEGEYDVMLECSAEPSVVAGQDARFAGYVIQNNLLGAVNCFEFARERSLGVIFFSTSRVYPYTAINSCHFREDSTRFRYDDSVTGVSERGISTDFTLNGPRSLYGATKLAAELLLTEYAAAYGVKSIINRCGVIAGPWQLGKVDQGVFTYWLAAHHFRQPLRYIGFGGNGKQVRDVLHIDDLAVLIRRQVDVVNDHAASIFNVGGSTIANLSLSETTALCARITGNKVDVGSDAATRSADVIWYVTDNGVTADQFNWRPTRKGEDVLSDTWRWLRDNEMAFASIFGSR
jgi:CDP-paratose 2-epimerase